MKRKWIYAMSVLLLMSFAFAWNSSLPTPPGTSYSILGYNFIPSTLGVITGTTNIRELPMDIAPSGGSSTFNLTHMNVTAAAGMTLNNISIDTSGNYTFYVYVASLSATLACQNRTGSVEQLMAAPIASYPAKYQVNMTDYNATDYKFVSGPGASNLYNNTFCSKAGGWLRLSISASGSSIGIPLYNVSSYSKTSVNAIGSTMIAPQSDYLSTIYQTGSLRSDFKAGSKNADPSTYCKALLYFNNPYYGNIQLIPKITFFPGTDAFGYFYNNTDNSAYLLNGSITYLLDSVTGVWYIVPATTCANYNLIQSVSTLQYDPTGTGTTPGGEIPIDVNDIAGSCAYDAGTRLITCTGTDSSQTITSLGLSAYKSGNTTDLCGASVGSYTGTLTCTLPNVNGTYNAYFYGTDGNLLQHIFSSKTIVIGGSTQEYGRDGYVATLLIFGVAAMVATANIAVAMVLGVFGLFLALAFGVLPMTDAPVVIVFGVVALVIAYRLKV